VSKLERAILWFTFAVLLELLIALKGKGVL
jgi:hypothetical protein